MKRAKMRAEIRTKRNKSNTKMMVPIVVKPRNVWGVTANKRAIPPVLIVSVNHLRRVRWYWWYCMDDGHSVNVRPGKVM